MTNFWTQAPLLLNNLLTYYIKKVKEVFIPNNKLDFQLNLSLRATPKNVALISKLNLRPYRVSGFVVGILSLLKNKFHLIGDDTEYTTF